MRFQILRSSWMGPDSPESPCPGAVADDYVDTEVRPAWWRTGKEGIPAWWWAGSENHRGGPNGEFLRDVHKRRWFIEIDSVEALLALNRETNEELIVSGLRDGDPYIEIYDYYRE